MSNSKLPTVSKQKEKDQKKLASNSGRPDPDSDLPRRVEGMPKFDLDELLSFEEVRLRAAHDCELTRVCRPCVSRCCERRSPPLP